MDQLTFDYSATVYVYIYIDAYFSSEFIIFNFLHIFVLPDVASSVVPSVGLSFITFLI